MSTYGGQKWVSALIFQILCMHSGAELGHSHQWCASSIMSPVCREHGHSIFTHGSTSISYLHPSYFALGVPSPLCILQLTRQIHIELQSKHKYVYVIYKVLVYVQTSQPTTCFGLFQLGHLQVGHKGPRKYTIMQFA